MSPCADKKSSTVKPKKGGHIVDDLKYLAVPFALMLAKKGVDASTAAKAKAPTPKKTRKSGTMAPAAAKKATTMRRLSTMAGGCSSGCGHVDIAPPPMMGGMKKLSKSIDKFLKAH